MGRTERRRNWGNQKISRRCLLGRTVVGVRGQAVLTGPSLASALFFITNLKEGEKEEEEERKFPGTSPNPGAVPVAPAGSASLSTRAKRPCVTCTERKTPMSPVSSLLSTFPFQYSQALTVYTRSALCRTSELLGSFFWKTQISTQFAYVWSPHPHKRQHNESLHFTHLPQNFFPF